MKIILLVRTLVVALLLGTLPSGAASAAGLTAIALRTEYLVNPAGIEETAPRLTWRVESDQRGQKQTAYRLLVATSEARLAANDGELWDTGKVASDQTVNIAYAGKPLASRQQCFWKVQVWDKDGQAAPWSAPARWSMGLLKPADWKAQWISFRDTAPLHTNRNQLFLPPARHYRKDFSASKTVTRATIFSSALGIYELHLNGQRVGDAFFEPGWSDYLKRAYYRTHDVTALVKPGANCLGAIVADGWYAGYVGYGVLVGYGPNKVGRYFYGKTPALLAQLELEYADGSREVIGTDTTWQASNDGPIREADLIMGESYDARREDTNWCRPGVPPVSDQQGAKKMEAGATPALQSKWTWQSAIRAEDNGNTKAKFSDNCGSREVELGFQKPKRMQAYSGPPVRATEELKALRLTEPKLGTYIFDLGQNFAGVIRLKVKGPAGTKVQLRFGEMLHPDGRLMTENLRKARATDHYILRGDPNGETWQPRFTYHGFQFVELTGLPEKPGLDAVTGIALNSDTPIVGSFECDDPVMTQFWRNTVRTQKANFIELPTDCPQRDERLGWMGDAQAYIRTASYNADVAAFFTKWLDDVEEAQRDFGAYPDYCPYPMGHGAPGQTWGTAWTDAGIICPYTIWQVYGDTRVIERHWDSMVRFMEWRKKRAPDFKGHKGGNEWGDWLNVNEATPIELIDAAYFRNDASLMSQMARAIGRKSETEDYFQLMVRLTRQFHDDYAINEAASRLKVNTQTAYVLALNFGLTPGLNYPERAKRLAEMIVAKDHRMATGFLGTKGLLPSLSVHGQHDLACRLFQSRKFPSWGYEVEQGATSVWERWDSFTKEHGFNGSGGNQNASMNSFSHYAFGAVMEWGYRYLAGIDTDGVGFKRIFIKPGPPTPGSNPDVKPIDWVKAEYGSIHGQIVSHWRRDGNRFELNVTIPANTTATVFLPAKNAASITESGQSLDRVAGVKYLRQEKDMDSYAPHAGTTIGSWPMPPRPELDCAVLAVESGRYAFVTTAGR
ncbi:MAG: family 78 glycoside hydrolase catalytic domain [Verrucomicrobia bacterium]|nr:family 78 glycoside hydrolase catalytic domain [Verrucomicrobiota bacterium]